MTSPGGRGRGSDKLVTNGDKENSRQEISNIFFILADNFKEEIIHYLKRYAGQKTFFRKNKGAKTFLE